MSKELPATLNPVLGSHYPHRARVLYVLRRKASATPADFEKALTAWRSERPNGVVAGSLLTRAGVATEERQSDISGRFLPAGSVFTSYDGYVSLDIENYEPSMDDFDTLFAAAKGCLDSLADVVDLSESVALAGVVNLVISGQAPLAMILMLDRPAHHTIEQFNEWWVRHGDDHRRGFVGQAGYHQLHIAPELNARAAEAAGTATTELCIIDIMYLGSLDDAFASAIVPGSDDAKAIGADIQANVSLGRVSGAFFREV